MNIEKLAKRLREFTLDEIEMIAEANLETELEQLLNEGKIAFEQGRYKYVEKVEAIDYAIFSAEALNDSPLNFETAIKFFLEKYAKLLALKELMKLMNRFLG